ncbi:MAG TPA: SpoIIE family protein phosphatase [Nocardioidaceae bacterium]|nr:SpoIIE family protein phosphatase [Nocardioidaceae bacterium]
MGKLLLVEVTPDEEATLRAAVGPDSCHTVPVTDLVGAIDHDGADAVVIGSGAPSPLSAVQWVHRAEPVCGVLLITSPDKDSELRRSAMYAPHMPSTLAIVESGSAEVAQVAKEVLEAGRRRRVHAQTLAAVTSREADRTPHALAPTSLGALLDHAPFGVLVGDLTGSLVTWNRWAGDRLGLSNDAAGESLPALLPSPEYLEHAFALARAERLDTGVAATTVEGPGESVLEVSAAPTRLENGDLAVLVMLQDVSARRQAERTRDRLAEHVGLLGRVSEALSGTLDVEMALRRLADQVVPAFADWVSLQTYDQRGQDRQIVVRHRDPVLDKEAHVVQAGIVGGLGEGSPSRQVATTGGPVLLRTVSEEDLAEFVVDEKIRDVVRRMGVASVVSVPLPGRDETRGSMTLVRTATSPPFLPQDLAVGVEVGRRAGVALDTLSLYARQRDLAAELQRSLLTDPPQTEQTEVVVRYVAAAEEAQVGGDWYDAFLQADGSTVLVIGDVMGHDTRAAAAMGQLRALLRGIGYTTSTGPAEMLGRLDAAIEGLRVQTTATSLVVQIAPLAGGETGTAELCWSNAGHPPAIVVPPGGGAVALENDEPDLLLGVLAHTERQESEASLRPGGTLLLYTDGLIERRGESIDEGLAALTAAVDRLSSLPLPQMCDQVLAEMLPEDNDDDVALVAVRVRGPGDGNGVQQ